jgi:hypothetical protein
MEQSQPTINTEVGSLKRIRGWSIGSARIELTCENLAWLAVAIGVYLRVWEYLAFRGLYMDEAALLENLVGRDVFDFHQVLSQDQLAPPAFLVLERLLVRLPMNVVALGRLFPLLCGVASMFLMRTAAFRYLDRRAAPIAVALFALADHLIYYSGELKQYSCDLFIALLGLVLVARPRVTENFAREQATVAFFGLVAPWFSFSAAFVLGSIGTYRIVAAAIRKQWRNAAINVFTSLTWLLSFGLCIHLSRTIMSKRRFLWDWWDFAFLPLPPRSWADMARIGETLANVAIHPGSILSPLEFPGTAILACSLGLVGCWSLGRRWPGGLFLVLSPLFFGMVASGLRQYPFHGRLLLWLVPTYLLLIAEGIAAIGRRTHLVATLVLAGFLIYGQAAEIVWNKWITGQSRSRPFDSHGDLKNDLLDYLERARTQPRNNPASGDQKRPAPAEPQGSPSR